MDGLNLYNMYVDVNGADKIGLGSEDVDPNLAKKIQDIVDEIGQQMPDDIVNALPNVKGTWWHKRLEHRLKGLDVLLITENSIDEFGKIVPRGTKGCPIPDIIILKKGTNISAILNRRESLVGKVDSVIDLKTGLTGIKNSWAYKVEKRLRVGFENIHTLVPYGNLAAELKKAPAVRGMAKLIMKKGIKKTLAKAIIFAGVMLAFQDAKARNMSTTDAFAYATASIVGADLIYDAGKLSAETIEGTAENFAYIYKNNLLNVEAVEKTYGQKLTPDTLRVLDRMERRNIKPTFKNLRKELLP